MLPVSQVPSSRDMYNADTLQETDRVVRMQMDRNYRKARDPYNENVIGPRFNEIGSLGKRVSKKRRKTRFINDGTVSPVEAVQMIDESPMFRSDTFMPAQKPYYFEYAPGGTGDNAISVPRVGSRKADTSINAPVTKEEHFANFTVHGPANSNDPRFHNNMVPYIRGKNATPFNMNSFQPHLEHFTGQTGEVTEWQQRPKQAVKNFGDITPDSTFPYGTPAENLTRTLDRYWTSGINQGVRPVDQIRTGPGVGYGYDAQPRDGRHPRFRPYVRNIDDLRVNPRTVTEGRVVAGAAHVKMPGDIGLVGKKHPKTYFHNTPDRWIIAAPEGARRPTERENFDPRQTRRELSTALDYFGTGGDASGLYVPHQIGEQRTNSATGPVTAHRQPRRNPNLDSNQGYMAGKNRVIAPALGACDYGSVVVRNNRTNYDVTSRGMASTRTYQHAPGPEFVNEKTNNRRGTDNPYQPLDHVVSQFLNNPFSQPLDSAVPMTS